jgi:hypothetical protein
MITVLHFPPCSPPRLFISANHQTECGRSSGVEHNLAKVRVESSNLFARSSLVKQYHGFQKRPPGHFLLRMRRENYDTIKLYENDGTQREGIGGV